MKKKNSFIILITSIIILMASCTSSRPSYVLDNSDMEDLLYDIHRAHFIQQQSEDGTNGAKQYALFLSVLKKHNVSQADWDSSMVYYTRHADELQAIYDQIMQRVDNEASAMGAGMSEASDSSDIWKADRHFLLTSDNLYSTYQWKMDTDTLLKSNEKINLRFLALFLNQETDRRATALIAMRLKNDSVVVRQQALTQTAIYNLELSDNDNIGIKSLSGLIMLHSGSRATSAFATGNEESNNAQTSQILAISDIKLLHEDKLKEQKEAARRDSLNRNNRPDSIAATRPPGQGNIPSAPMPASNLDQAPPPPPPHHP